MPAATTVVIATYNRERMLRETVASVQQQSTSTALVVVDDCSSDGTREWLAEHPGLTAVLLEERSERAAARNIGLSRVETEFVLFLDDDDCLTPTAVAHLERAAARFPDAAAVIGGSQPMPGFEGGRLAIASHDQTSRRALRRVIAAMPWLLRSPVLRGLLVRTAAVDVARQLLPGRAFDQLRRRLGR